VYASHRVGVHLQARMNEWSERAFVVRRLSGGRNLNEPVDIPAPFGSTQSKLKVRFGFSFSSKD
jgi:hypothetical protein